MALFSEKYGYEIPSNVLIREKLTEEIVNAICSVYDMLKEKYKYDKYNSYVYAEMEKYLWRYFLNNRLEHFGDIYNGYVIVATNFLEDDNAWYKKLNMIEKTIHFLRKQNYELCNVFIAELNCEFERLNFAYRIINDCIVEVTSEEEIKTIEIAINNSSNGIKEHLQTALKLLSQRPNGDYRNSIKESISAVEALVREITGENKLNFNKLKAKGIILPDSLINSFKILYGYTNDKTTGIRHALMDDTNVPSADEAIFMLVSCSAFINYLNKKRS